MPDKTDEILVHLEYLRKGQDETNAHLKLLNGRMAKVETRASVLESQSANAATAGAKSGGVVGGLITAGGVLWQIFRGGS